jgi:hypothetical protein
MKTAILCRTNAPLVTAAFDLIKKGRSIKVRIIGRDVAKKLKDLCGEILDYRRNADIEEFLGLLDAWIVAIRAKYTDEKHEDFVAECEDYHGCLKAICHNCNDAKCVYATIDTYFVDSDEVADSDDSIILCSGHRAKGLEWDRVIWLRPDLMPHPGAKTPADLKQEDHLIYILPTRAKKELIICHDKQP